MCDAIDTHRMIWKSEGRAVVFVFRKQPLNLEATKSVGIQQIQQQHSSSGTTADVLQAFAFVLRGADPLMMFYSPAPVSPKNERSV